jgi:hypothetical protein
MAYSTVLLEFSPDPLSDSSPAFVDVTSDLMEAEWFSGKTRDLEEPQPGGAMFRLKNTNRRWEPDYAAGAFLPCRRGGCVAGHLLRNALCDRISRGH